MICSARFCFAMLKKSEAFISLLLLPRRWVVLESQADRDKWHGCQCWDLSSCNSAACLHQDPSMQAKFTLAKRKDRTSGLSIPSLMQRPGWCTRPYHFVWIFLSVPPIHSVGFLQGPASCSCKVWALTCWGEFQRSASMSSLQNDHQNQTRDSLQNEGP